MQRAPSRDTSRTERRRPFLARLARDAGGNTLAIVGAALIPLTAMIGSGIDMSRAYMAKTRLQSACDAAALAGRRVMTNDTLSDDVRETATEFFNFNFPQGLYQTAGFTPAVSRPDRGVVQVEAATTIPTSIMAMFGFTSLPLSVECEASHDFVNTDIVMVLDVTGSMDANLNGVKMIQSLRDAVMELYDELAPVQAELKANNMRLRYGFVPYASTVNVGRLLDQSHIANQAIYQSRRMNTYTETGITQSTCNNRPNNNRSWNRTSGSGSSARGTCSYDDWIYEAVPTDVSRFKTFLSTAVPTREIGTTQNATWTGCIEERATVNTITPNSGYNIPSGAYDLNINHIPNNDATRWRPHWPEVVYQRTSGGASRTSGSSLMSTYNATYYACPAEAKRLDEWSRSGLQSYVNTLQPMGGTYLDIGMIWGARLISNAGVFGDSPNTYNGMPVNRHIIFMTDGAQTAYCNVYSAWGIERNDMRVHNATNCTSDAYSNDVPTNAVTRALLAKHQQRFRMICNAAKGMNVSIWVVAFNTDLTADLRECASSEDQASISLNRADLIEQFREIGKNIGALRLTQ